LLPGQGSRRSPADRERTVAPALGDRRRRRLDRGAGTRLVGSASGGCAKRAVDVKTLARSTDKAEILRPLQNLRLDSPRRWGRMTAHQTICHLADANRAALGEISVSLYTPWWSRT